MIIHKAPLFTICFGDRRHCVVPCRIRENTAVSVFSDEPFASFKRVMNLDYLVLPHQVHGVHGVIIDSIHDCADIPVFKKDGDFLVTTIPRAGVGVVTADCLPLVCVSVTSCVVGIAHIGWRGAVKGIISRFLSCIDVKTKQPRTSLSFFLGPSSKRCCYQVDKTFVERLPYKEWHSNVLYYQNKTIFFDLSEYICLLLGYEGIHQQQINRSYNLCTICNGSYCSYRREQHDAARQITIVSLK